MSLKIEDISLEDLIEFRDHGNRDASPPEVVAFFEIMEKVRGMHLRFDKFGSRDAIVNHLVKVDGHSHYLACKFHDTAMEYFYSDRDISKNAWRNIIAEKMDKAISLGFALAKDVNDVTKIAKSLKDLSDTLGLNVQDPEPFPEELLGKPFKMYSLDMEFLGMPKIDRYALARQIDDLPEMSEKERLMAKREALILPPKLFLDAHEDPRATER